MTAKLDSISGPFSTETGLPTDNEKALTVPFVSNLLQQWNSGEGEARSSTLQAGIRTLIDQYHFKQELASTKDAQTFQLLEDSQISQFKFTFQYKREDGEYLIIIDPETAVIRTYSKMTTVNRIRWVPVFIDFEQSRN